MDPLSDLQDDLTLDDTSQALNQLKLASIDEKNWPSDEMPDFPKSGGHYRVLGSHRHRRQRAPSCWREGDSRRAGWGPGSGWEHKCYWGAGGKEQRSWENAVPVPQAYLVTLACSSDDSKSSSPEPVTHLKWDDPYYDIARHQIVEVAGEHTQLCTFFLVVCTAGTKEALPLVPQGKGLGGAVPIFWSDP